MVRDVLGELKGCECKIHLGIQSTILQLGDVLIGMASPSVTIGVSLVQ